MAYEAESSGDGLALVRVIVSPLGWLLDMRVAVLLVKYSEYGISSIFYGTVIPPLLVPHQDQVRMESR